MYARGKRAPVLFRKSLNLKVREPVNEIFHSFFLSVFISFFFSLSLSLLSFFFAFSLFFLSYFLIFFRFLSFILFLFLFFFRNSRTIISTNTVYYLPKPRPLSAWEKTLPNHYSVSDHIYHTANKLRNK